MRIIIDVGATKTLVLAVNSGGKELARRRFATDKDYSEYKQHLHDAIESICEETTQPLEVIAIAMPGVINYQTKIVEAFGNRDWKNVDIAPYLERVFKVPIGIDNDANFGAVGAARRGAGRGYRVVLYVTISTGIGTGVAVDGKISPALAKSEAGAMQFKDHGRYKQWEKMASGKAFYRKYKRYGRDTPASEVKIWKEYGASVAQGLEELIAVIQPDVIVIGGSMGEHLPKYIKYVKQLLKRLDKPVTKVPPIVAAEKPDEVVVRGGIEVADDILGS